MTIEEKVEQMKTMMSDTSIEDNQAIVYLNLARDEIINHIYPFEHNVVELESKYDYKQIQLAIVLFNLKGAEGESSHSENGVNRSYKSVEKILNSIPKKAGLPL